MKDIVEEEYQEQNIEIIVMTKKKLQFLGLLFNKNVDHLNNLIKTRM